MSESYGYQIKRGVLFFVSPEIEQMLDVLGPVYEQEQIPLWITSGVEGPHRDGSMHYQLRAFDTRSYYKSNPKLKEKVLRAAERAVALCKSQGLPVKLRIESDHHHWEWGTA